MLNDIAIFILGMLTTCFVVAGIIVRTIYGKHVELAGTDSALKSDLGKVVEVHNKNFTGVNDAIKEVNDRVAKIQTVGFLTKRVQPDSNE